MVRWQLGLALAATLMVAPSAKGDDPGRWFDEHEIELVDLYRHLHAHPELSYKEAATSAKIADELKKAGAEVTTGVGGFGVVGLLKNGQGPTVLVRSDLDALPVLEATGLPFASKATAPDEAGNPVGVMHACGHDIHMTNLVATARWLAEHKGQWSGTVIFIGQPAEEKIGGAKKMLADGLYQRFPKPDFALALHVAHDLEAGKVAYTSGPAMAGSTSVDVLVKGKGGHGAAPHSTVDPIVLAASLVLDLQTIVSREVNPIYPAVVTVGSIHGGTKHNIIPDDCQAPIDPARLPRRRPRAARGEADQSAARRAWPSRTRRPRAGRRRDPRDGPRRRSTTPALVANASCPMLTKSLGDGQRPADVEPVMGAEDFGRYFGQGGVPIVHVPPRLGPRRPPRRRRTRRGEKLPSLHSAQIFRPDALADDRRRDQGHDRRRRWSCCRRKRRTRRPRSLPKPRGPRDR